MKKPALIILKYLSVVKKFIPKKDAATAAPMKIFLNSKNDTIHPKHKETAKNKRGLLIGSSSHLGNLVLRKALNSAFRFALLEPLFLQYVKNYRE